MSIASKRDALCHRTVLLEGFRPAVGNPGCERPLIGGQEQQAGVNVPQPADWAPTVTHGAVLSPVKREQRKARDRLHQS